MKLESFRRAQLKNSTGVSHLVYSNFILLLHWRNRVYVRKMLNVIRKTRWNTWIERLVDAAVLSANKHMNTRGLPFSLEPNAYWVVNSTSQKHSFDLLATAIYNVQQLSSKCLYFGSKWTTRDYKMLKSAVIDVCVDHSIARSLVWQSVIYFRLDDSTIELMLKFSHFLVFIAAQRHNFGRSRWSEWLKQET